jgi:purine-binding chemotaxis protein CheW
MRNSLASAGTENSAGADSVTGGLAGKYLTVLLGTEAFGISVLKVREIIRLQKITPVPRMPAFVKGVINLRGRVIPVVDLRVKFGLKAETGERTCIVVVQISLPEGQALQMGLIVDGVEEVVNVPAAEIEPTPTFGVAVETAYLLGMAKVKGCVKALLDIDRVIAPDALQTLTPDLSANS